MTKCKSSMLHRIAAHYIMGDNIKASIEGTPLQLEIFNNLLKTSKDLRESLYKNKDFEDIVQLIETKKELTKQFQNITGIKWYL